MTDAPDLSGYGPDTRALRAGIERGPHHEMSESLFLTQGYVYDSAAQAEAAFAGDIDIYQYSRYGNPSVTAFQERLRAIEGAEACFATATGMAAVFVSLAALLRNGDRLVTARELFGSSISVFNEYFAGWGIEVTYVPGGDLDAWRDALARPAKVVFFETPTNPMLEVLDVAAIAEMGHAAGATVVVDNVFATPLGQRPLELGADAVVYSATKHIDGQGRVLGGAVLGGDEYVEQVRQMVRTMGATMSPFNGWVLSKSLETLGVRMRAQCAATLELAAWLEEQPGIARVYYPLLPSHPQYDLAKRQMTLGGTVLTVDLAIPDGADAKAAAFAFVDGLALFETSNNLGDAKSIVTHPATTTHRKIGPEARAAVGISDASVRLSVGLEDPADLRADLTAALAAVAAL